jgi:hypothetical protein
MKKISEDIMGEAYEELAVENDTIRKSAEIDKTAFDVSINPASLIGSITGSLIARKKIQSDNLKRLMENENSSILQGNYYQQVQNLVSNLKIIFTPFGVVYVVRSGSKEITIETIGTDEMNSPMYMAWKQKDVGYFKNVLLNKMHTEIQFVEQEFAKKILENHMGMQAHVTKKASADVDYNEMSVSELISGIAELKDFYESKTEATEKFAEILCRVVDDGTEYRVSWEFQRPLEKYALLGGALDFLGLGGSSDDIRSLQGSYLNPSYLANRVKAGFLPDRVIFIVDNKVISSLLAIDMNSEAFDYFNKQNQKFFVDYFNKEAKKGIKRMKGKLPSNSNIVKEASIAIEDIFNKVDIHPVVYFKMLNDKYGAKWMRWEIASLIKTLEQDFALEDGMNDQALNKIMAIHSVNNNMYPFTNYHVFEKVIRSFSGRPIDFLEREVEDLDVVDIAFGLDVMDEITPKVDTFEHFSSDVINYIIDNLVDNHYRVFNPLSLFSDSESRREFYDHLNEYLLDGFNAKDIVSIEDTREQSESIRENEVIHHMSMNIILKVRSQISKEFNQAEFIKSEIANIDESQNIRDLISIQVVNGLLIDRMLIRSQLLLKKQLDSFGMR